MGIRTVKSILYFLIIEVFFLDNRRLSAGPRWAAVRSLDIITKKFTLGLVTIYHRIVIWPDTRIESQGRLTTESSWISFPRRSFHIFTSFFLTLYKSSNAVFTFLFPICWRMAKVSVLDLWMFTWTGRSCRLLVDLIPFFIFWLICRFIGTMWNVHEKPRLQPRPLCKLERK